LRCARCGNENSDANRFCGMCGAKLLAGPDPVATVTAESAANRAATLRATVPVAPATPVTSQTVSPQTTAPRTSAPLAEVAPVISGPSFLGLNQPESAPRRRGSLSIDPNSAPSSTNLDYLLRDDGDEEEERGGGAGKFILILLALVLAVGLGYLRWKNQGFGWLGSGTSKPSASAPVSDATTPGSSTPSSTTGSPADSGAPSTAPAAVPVPTQPASTPPPANTPAAVTSAPNPAAASAPANAAPTAATAPATDDAANSPADSTTVAPSPAAKAPAADTPPPTSAKASKTDDAPSAKPTAAIRPVKVDPVSEAQKYIYGRGVPQNCDRGMRLLKPAADQANPRAMIEMGALYSAGLCTPHDLPTAYRWFALALRKDPDNQSVQTDLSKLWGEMTQPERQLAIKLSQ
jgi:hypothetical protein